MIKEQKEQLFQLSKEQLVYLIEKLNHSMCLIGETCVDVSKSHIDYDDAISQIRKYIYYVPNKYNLDDFMAYINMEMGKISEAEYRKIIGLDD